MAKTRSVAAPPSKERINEQIRSSQVRVVSADGDQLGILSVDEALEAARSAGLDLVEVAPTETPPVCRILDYGKYKYQQKKRQNRSHSHQTKVKEIRVRPKTGKHDIEVKVNRARDFLKHKDKVLITVQFRGREMAHIEEGRKVLNEILESLEDVAKVESSPNQQGRRISCTISAK
ncbi:MAG: translation initiation factor IF-3 [Planctomycetia bacterium]|jgi:translation initiation factor IF-3